ncbi:Pex12 amino terminal region-domain-containing protein [Flagelloscypha sp. PMI_526]|nr:Pex12 amino terminal region-domain-containing protein [Flagelloscypha sp. PMI_526]
MPKVAILDSELLDNDLINVLLEPFQKSLSLVNASLKSRLQPELMLLLQATLYKLSVWDSSATYGAKLQDLRYVYDRSSNHAPTIPRTILAIHGSLTILFPYVHARIRSYALSHSWSEAPTRDYRRRAWEMLSSLETASSSIILLNFIGFLWSGRYRTVVDRITGMALVPASKLAHREVSYEFMNRQMVWHAFTEFLLFALPLVNAKTLRQRISRAYTHLSPALLLPPSVRQSLNMNEPSPAPSVPTRGPFWSLPRDQCAICAEDDTSSSNRTMPSSDTSFANLYAVESTAAPPPDVTSIDSPEGEPPNPINTPYVASCGDVYCYHCLVERMLRTAEEDERAHWICIRCGVPVTAMERKTVPIEYDSSSEFDSFTSNGSGDIETDGMSASVSMGSSYSDSSLFSD